MILTFQECMAVDQAEVQTRDLAGPALDWSVAQAIGLEVGCARAGTYGRPNSRWMVHFGLNQCGYAPSRDWRQGGLLIDQHRVSVHCPRADADGWAAWVSAPGWATRFVRGCTSLQAACRAIVAAKCGPVVTVPAFLVQKEGKPC